MQPISGRTNLPAITLLLPSLVALAGCNDRSSQPASVENPPRPARQESTEGERRDEYVGSATCAECHSEEYESYRNTAHSRSLSLVDPDSEPPDGRFLHESSGRTYEIYRRDGQLHHREALPAADGEAIAESDYPVKYLVGSGSHSRTYLSEVDGFLVESPITWYESRREWDVSPGYDVPFPPGFERAADLGCLVCHVGRAEEIEGSLHRIRFHELAIGCERCHGPGREHVDAARSEQPPVQITAAITNPDTLSRSLVEDICAQCHLRANATVFFPGLGPMDFRPGRPLTSIRVDYSVNTAGDRMKVVGHVEQMRYSRCYTQSNELTCTTCHLMHAAGEETTDFYRSRCLDCHTVASCGLPEDNGRRLAEQDNCMTCHMPQSQTDIPHIAFTHHRIGIHQGPAPEHTPGPAASIAPCGPPLDGVSSRERRRLEGLAWLELADAASDEAEFQAYQGRALPLLEEARADGGDPDVDAALARLFWTRGSDAAAMACAERALGASMMTSRSRTNTLFVTADIFFRAGDFRNAIAVLEELKDLHRQSEVRFLLGLSRVRIGDLTAARRDLAAAVEIAPFRVELRTALADVYRGLGDDTEAARQRQISRQLQATMFEPAAGQRPSQ